MSEASPPPPLLSLSRPPPANSLPSLSLPLLPAASEPVVMEQHFVDPVEQKLKDGRDVRTLESGTQAWQGGDSLRARETGQPNANATQQGVHLDELSSSSSAQSAQNQSSSGDQSSDTGSGAQAS